MIALREGIQTSQERIRITWTLTGPVPTYPLLGSENLSHLPLGGLANPGADHWNGFLEERSRASRKTREGSGRERDGAAPKTPARVYGPGSEWSARVGWAHPEGQGGVCLGLETGARGLRSGARVTCEEGRKSPKRGACCELGVLGAPRAAGARAPGRAGDAAGTGPRRRGRRREWEGRRQRRTQPADSLGETGPGQGSESSDEVHNPAGGEAGLRHCGGDRAAGARWPQNSATPGRGSRDCG